MGNLSSSEIKADVISLIAAYDKNSFDPTLRHNQIASCTQKVFSSLAKMEQVESKYAHDVALYKMEIEKLKAAQLDSETPRHSSDCRPSVYFGCSTEECPVWKKSVAQLKHVDGCNFGRCVNECPLKCAFQKLAGCAEAFGCKTGYKVGAKRNDDDKRNDDQIAALKSDMAALKCEIDQVKQHVVANQAFVKKFNEKKSSCKGDCNTAVNTFGATFRFGKN